MIKEVKTSYYYKINLLGLYGHLSCDVDITYSEFQRVLLSHWAAEKDKTQTDDEFAESLVHGILEIIEHRMLKCSYIKLSFSRNNLKFVTKSIRIREENAKSE